MCRKIILLRHGTPLIKDSRQRYIGRTDLLLSEKGKYEAEAVGLWLRENADDVEAVYTSPLIRALETAKIAASVAGFPEPIIAPELSEINLGDWEGRLVDEIRERYPEQFVERGRNAWDFRIPGGETFHDTCVRFSSFLADALGSTQGNILLVSHSGVMRAFLCEVMGISGNEIFLLHIPMAGLTILNEHDGKLSVLRFGFLPEKTLTREKINELYRKYDTPRKIIGHMEAVASFAEDILHELGGNFHHGRIIKAALLHDLLRVERGHARLGAEALRCEGYDEIAKLVEVHNDAEFSPDTALTDADILWYSDKRVQDDCRVTLGVRFANSLKNCETPEARLQHSQRWQKALNIQKKLKERGVML